MNRNFFMARKIAFILIVASVILSMLSSPMLIYRNSNSISPEQTIASPLSPKASAVYMELFVSPNGSDTNSGNITHPLKTIDKAREMVSENLSSMTGDIIVWIRGGEYVLDSPLMFTQNDSGQNGYDVIYAAYPNETPIISGGVSVNGWVRNQTGSNVWVANSPIADFRQLYINGVRAIRARGPPTMIESTDADGHKLNDLSITRWNNLNDVEFVYKTLWTLPRIRIHWYYTIKNVLIMQQPAYAFARAKSADISSPTWIENAIELLDEPGEFYLDKSTGKLYYIPREGETMETAKVIVPNIETLLQIEGNQTHKASNLKFQGLNFQYATWLEPNQFGTCFVDLQANVFVILNGTVKSHKMSPGNIRLRFAERVSIENCTFSKFGSGGVDLQRGTNNIAVVGNTFKDLSGIAIQIGELDLPFINATDPRAVRDILVMNNYITNCSVEYMGGPGIFTGYVRNVRIEHNTISNLPYTGISLGWGWSGATTVMANNTIKYNRIYGVMNFLADGGGIYTLSTQEGTNVSYNVIHDSGWNGLYPDERTNGTTWTFNVVYDTFNSIQNHIMFYDEMGNDAYALNNISNNYLEKYPVFAIPKGWDQTEAKQQIYGLKPGDAEFPQWIVDMSGVEPQYRHLIPENEWYWKYNPIKGNPNIFMSNIALSFGMLFSIAGIGIIQLILINKRRSISR
jgi:hypothetical protein